MKKILILGLALVLLIALSSAKNSFAEKSSEKNLAGRQCCTKISYMADGSSISITACAGWFLSNDARALQRACDKVNEAMGLQ